MSESILSLFSSRSFMVSCLIFKSLSHFEFIFVYNVRECSNFIALHALSSFSNTTCWREYLFSIAWICLLCWRIIDHRCMSLFLYFVPLLYMSVFVPVPYRFDYCSFVLLSEVWEGYAFYFILFSQDCFGNSEDDCLQCYVWIYFSFCVYSIDFWFAVTMKFLYSSLF